MFKYLFKVIVIFLFLTLNSKSEIVKNIEITGNKRISKETILVLANINIDDEFTDISLNNALKELYQTDFFSDIKFLMSVDGLLKIDVKENPIIEKININGIKKKSFVENIYTLISLKDRTSFTDYKLERDISLVKNILKTNGYYFSSIKVSS